MFGPNLLTRGGLILLLAALEGEPAARAAAPVHYTFRFPELNHHWMQVEASFPELASAPLELRVSRSSPGRYSLHDFAKNVYDVHAWSEKGEELLTTRPDPYGWTVPKHGESVLVKYKVFGDLVDGTYLAIDSTHAHINMPAVIMWARGMDDRPAAVSIAEPAGRRWQIATQLHDGESPPDGSARARGSTGNSSERQFTAPNLQYLMDSPVEVGPLAIRQFAVGDRRFRFAVHHAGSDDGLDGFVKDVEKIVRVEAAIFGELPPYEPGRYTFIADYLPYADEDGMEHRNSTVMTSRGSIASARVQLLDTCAHEFFHSWNVERIRPRSLEPFDLERVNMSGELWLAEGFTQYFGPLALSRAGLADLRTTLGTLGAFITSVLRPAHRLRSAVQMSEMAAFVDGGRPVDRTNWSNTYISYYQYGAAIALALDLALRERSDGRETLDDYMRAMWRVHGRPEPAREGYVDRPYTVADAEARLAEVAGDRQFARNFFARYIEGYEVPDFDRLVAAAGLSLRKRNPGKAWWGNVRLEFRGGGGHVTAAPSSDSPAYAAGVDVDDEIRQIDGVRIGSTQDLTEALERHRPGDRVPAVVIDRSGASRTVAVTLAEDPRLELVALDSDGGSITAEQRTFRERWLGRRQP
jgi:predicted metalloprotease with PDZ domain